MYWAKCRPAAADVTHGCCGAMLDCVRFLSIASIDHISKVWDISCPPSLLRPSICVSAVALKQS